MSWFDRWIWRRPQVRQQMTLEDLVAESGTPTWAGVPVGTDQAMRLSTVWACVRLLADSVSTLPVDVFRRGEREPLQPPPILITPAAGWALHDWLEAVMRSLLLRGNAYGLVVARGSDLRPSQVELIHPDAMTVRVNREGMVEYRLRGKPQPAEDIWHVRAFRMPGLVEGLSPIEYARQSIGLGLAVERYGATWFADGGVPPGPSRTPSRPSTRSRPTRSRAGWCMRSAPASQWCMGGTGSSPRSRSSLKRASSSRRPS